MTPSDPLRCNDGCNLELDSDGHPMACEPHGNIGPYIDDSDAP